MSEQAPLLPSSRSTGARPTATRALANAALVVLFLVGVPLMLFLGEGGAGLDELPKDPLEAANAILSRHPIIDGHIDLPELVRMVYANNASAVDLAGTLPADVDIPRLRKGHVGGFFWSVYVSCPDDDSLDFTRPNDRVRDTLEQIDVTKYLIDKYSDTFHPATSAADVRAATEQGKIASLIGVEGGHQIGNSLHVLRQLYALGARYMTLTHMCNNAFADSAGIISQPSPVHGGLSPLGVTLVREMNRLGMLVDVSHVSDASARQAIKASRAPVMWSHSSLRALVDISRNLPDDVLAMTRERDGVVMINFAPYFVARDANATVLHVADHVEHAAKVAGKEHVGIGSDFDGIGSTPTGLEDVSKYPELFAELIRRGWTARELAGLAGGNFLRVLEKVERVAADMRAEGVPPAMDLYGKRPDLPVPRRKEL